MVAKVNYLDDNSGAPITSVSPMNQSAKPPFRTTPVYLVLIEDPSKIKLEQFLATKLDESVSVLKLVGVETQKTMKEISKNYLTILSSTDKALYKEYSIPWGRVYKIQNLSFKHK